VFWSSRAGGSPRRLLIVAAAALIPVLAGCEAGNGAPTLNWHYPTVGAGTLVHGIAIRNVFVLGAPDSEALPAGRSASLFLALVNTGTSPDRLLSISAPGTATAVTIPGGSIPLAPNHAVLLTGPQPVVILSGLIRTLTGGSVVTLRLNFQKAGTETLKVPVISRSQEFGTFSPPPAPSPTATATAGGHHGSASPSPSTSASPTASPSPSPSTS
jgi:copper(I)-binding protein